MRKPTEEQERVVDEYVRRVVDAAPPLTPEQRDKLAILLGPVVSLEDIHAGDFQ